MQLLDRLLKDIVTESDNFEIEAFMPLLGERIYVSNPFSRQFLVGWIATLDSVGMAACNDMQQRATACNSMQQHVTACDSMSAGSQCSTK